MYVLYSVHNSKKKFILASLKVHRKGFRSVMLEIDIDSLGTDLDWIELGIDKKDVSHIAHFT